MIKQLFKKSKTIQRIRTIKDLFLEKLDALNLKSDQQIGQASLLLEEGTKTQHNTHILIERTGEIQSTSNQILENNVFLLKFSVDIVKGIEYLIVNDQQRQETTNRVISEIREESQRRQETTNQVLSEIREESQRSYQYLIQKLIEVQEDSRSQDTFARKTLSEIYADIHNQKFKVIADRVYFQDIDIELMVYLYSYLPYHRAIDIGANRGDVSSRLLQTGYEVYAFEPFPPVLEKLKARLGDNPRFHAFPFALGSANETRDLHLAADQTEDQIYEDATFYSSLTRHSLSEGLTFSDTLSVNVKTLASLHESAELPADIGLVKIDTEGFDLEVIKGMENFIYPVVIAEFWDSNFPFGRAGAMNHLKDMVKAMRERNYHWHIVIYRIWGSPDISYYCNSAFSLENSWGNVFFFQDYEVFGQALKWCSAIMPATYFSV